MNLSVNPMAFHKPKLIEVPEVWVTFYFDDRMKIDHFLAVSLWSKYELHSNVKK